MISDLSSVDQARHNNAVAGRVVQGQLSDACIHCMEMLDDLLVLRPFCTHELYVFSTQGNSKSRISVIPTLSAYRGIGDCQKTYIFSSLEDIRLTLQNNSNIALTAIPDDLTLLLDTLQRHGFECSVSYDFHTVVAARGQERLQATDIESIVHLTYRVRRYSLNMRNASHDLCERERSRLMEVPALSLNDVSRQLAKHCASTYGLRAICAARVPHTSNWSVVDDVLPEGYSPRNDQAQIFDAFQHILKSKADHLRSGKPLAGRLHLQYYVVFPLTRPHGEEQHSSILRLALICISDTPIPHFVPENLRAHVRSFFGSSLLAERKLDMLQQLEETKVRLSRGLQTTRRPGDFSLKLALTQLAGDSFEGLLQTTAAHSLSVRLYNPQSRTLDRLLLRESQHVTRLIDEGESFSIPLSSAMLSVNVRTFLNCGRNTKRQYLYEPTLGLSDKPTFTRSSYLHHRDETLCELCLPLYFKDIKIGTFNIEAPDEDSLRPDIDYIMLVKNTIESHLALLMDAHDAGWLARRAEIYHRAHKLIRMAEELAEASSIPAELGSAIHSLIDIRRYESTAGPCFLGQLVSHVDDFYVHLERTTALKATAREKRRGVRVRIADPQLAIDAFAYRIIVMMLDNMLDNYVHWGDPETDTFILAHDGRPSTPLLLFARSDRILDINVLASGFEAPVLRPDPQRHVDGNGRPRQMLRYGMFITGSLARQLGGFASVNASEESETTEFRVNIPLMDYIRRK